MLSQTRLKELLTYDKDTGVFTWRRRRGGKAAVGRCAGARDFYGYVVIRLDGVLYKAHRLAWFYSHGVWPEENIDHINRDKSDNRLKNLRLAGQSLNMHNANRRAGSSGVVGVTWDAQRRKWHARIKIDYVNKFLGRFDKKDAAIKAREEAVKNIMSLLGGE